MSTADLDAAMSEVQGVLRSGGVARDRVRVVSCDAATTTARTARHRLDRRRHPVAADPTRSHLVRGVIATHTPRGTPVGEHRAHPTRRHPLTLTTKGGSAPADPPPVHPELSVPSPTAQHRPPRA